MEFCFNRCCYCNQFILKQYNSLLFVYLHNFPHKIVKMSPLALCVVCVSERRDVVNMSSLYYGSIPASTFIMDILQIKVASDTSSGVVMCNRCNSSLNNFYKFYKMVRDAQHKYNQMVNNIKSETSHEYIMKVEPDAEGGRVSHDADIVQCKLEATGAPKCLSDGNILVPTASLLNEETVNITNPETTQSLVGSQRATEIVLAKYKPQDIFSGGEWKISEEEKDEIFTLYIDMKCNKCDAHFSNYNLLNHHCMTDHGTNAVVYCDNKPLPTYQHMERLILYKHILNRKIPRIRPRIPCKVCSKLVIDSHMKEHLSSHLPHDKREFQCDQCHAGFGTRAKLNSHVSNTHSKISFPCENCGKVFKTKLSLRNHRNGVHGPSDNLHLCPDCGKQIKNFPNYEEHIKEHQGLAERVKCNICHVVVKKNYISKHMTSHNSANLKQCPHCTFKGSKLSQHIRRVHEKRKPHACSFCPMTFFNAKTMEDHTAARHTGIPGYVCEFCKRTFMSSGNHSLHRKRMHPEQLAEKKKKIADKNDTSNIPNSSMIKNKKQNTIVEGDDVDLVIQNIQKRTKR